MNPIPYSLLRTVSLLYLAFVIYGSLVPLEYHAIPLDVAMQRFASIRFLNLGIGSRADWVANLLLFIPAAFFLCGAVWTRKKSLNLLISAMVLLFCIALTIAIEFTQLYFPQRTVSQNDLYAEAVGSLIGIIVWWQWGKKLSLFYQNWQSAQGSVQLAEKMLWIYIAILIGYNVLPLDLTISPVEIYHKWQSGKVNLIPFGFNHSDPALLIYELFTDAIIWLPVSLLLRLAGKSTRQAIQKTILFALLLEILQFFVYSRVTDITDLLTAALGATGGIYLARFFRAPIPSTTKNSNSSKPTDSILLPVMVFAIWVAVVLVIFWYPFNFSFERTLLRERVAGFFSTPFRAYYYGTEFRAITEVLHKIAFLLPFGAIAAWVRNTTFSRIRNVWLDRLVILLLLTPALLIEAGQLALPDKSAQITDLLLEWVGCILGYFGLLFIAKRWHIPTPHEHFSQQRKRIPATSKKMHPESPETQNSRKETRCFFNLILANLTLLWFAVIVFSPQFSHLLNQDSEKSLDFLTLWTQQRYAFTLAWSLALTCMTFTAAALTLARQRYYQAAPGRFIFLTSVIWIMTGLLPGMIFFLLDWQTLPVLIFTSVLGSVIGFLLAHWLPLPALSNRVLIFGLLLLVAFVPLDINEPLASGFGHSWLSIGDRLYFLLKSAILWVPLGFIAALAGFRYQADLWSKGLFWGFVLACLPLLSQAPVTALLNVCAVPLGCLAGLWLFDKTGLPMAEEAAL